VWNRRVNLSLLFILTSAAERTSVSEAKKQLFLAGEREHVIDGLQHTQDMLCHKIPTGLEDSKKKTSIGKMYMCNMHIYIRNKSLRV